MDGNNSAKRVASAGTADVRNFNSDYFMSRAEVDRFRDEVKYRAPPAKLRDQVQEDTVRIRSPFDFSCHV